MTRKSDGKGLCLTRPERYAALRLLAVVLIAWATACTPVQAGEPRYKPGGVYPSKPVRLVVPFERTSPAHAAATELARVLGDDLEKPVIVDARADAATEILANASPDGYTLLLSDQRVLAGTARQMPSTIAPVARIALADGGGATPHWIGLFVRAGTPYNIITHLHERVVDALSKPGVKLGFEQLQMRISPLDPEEFEAFIKAQRAKETRSPRKR